MFSIFSRRRKKKTNPDHLRHSNNSTVSWYPTGTGTGVSHTHPNPTTVSLATSVPYHTGSAITTVVTKTKTLTWTLYIPCTTTAYGTTSYYSTASIYTTRIPEYETVTLIESCGQNCYSPTPKPTSVYSTLVVAPPVVVESVAPIHSTSAVSSTCYPALTITVSAVKTVTVESLKTVTVESLKTVTVTETRPHTSIAITAAPAAATTTAGSAEHGMCRPGTPCYSHIHSHGSWNSTLAVTTRYHGTGTAALPSGTTHPGHY